MKPYIEEIYLYTLLHGLDMRDVYWACYNYETEAFIVRFKAFTTW